MFINTLFSVTIFLAAACGLTVEIVAGRLIAPIFGMSLYTWTSIIAVVLTGLSVGHWIGGQLASTNQSISRQFNYIASALLLASLSSLFILFNIDNFSNLDFKNFNFITLVIFTTASLFFLPSLFVGIVSPIITSLAVTLSPSKKTGLIIGRMYALGSLGAIFGTLLAGYYLVSSFGSRHTIFIVSALYAFLSLFFFGVSQSLKLRLLSIVCFVFAGSFSYVLAMKMTKSACHNETNYFCVQLQDIGPEGADVRLLALDHLVHSINDKHDARLLHAPYIHFVDEFAELEFADQKVPSAFFIGGGGYTLPRAWIKKYHGKANLYIAEIDPEITKIAKNQLWFDETESRTSIIHKDARVALRNMGEKLKFDLIFGDAFHDIAIPQHLVTREFNELVKTYLLEDGFYIVNIVDNSYRPMFLISYVKTISETFSNVQVWFEPNIIAQTGRVTYSVVASQKGVSRDFINSNYGFERTWWLWPTKKLHQSSLYRDSPVLTDDIAPVDKLMIGAIMTRSAL